MWMKQLLSLILLVCVLNMRAQIPDSVAKKMPPQMPALKGLLYGKIVDSLGKGIGSASVLLLRVKIDSATKKTKEELVKGVSTQSNGDFSLEDVPAFGKLKLSITATGYEPLDLDADFDINMPANRPAQGNVPSRPNAMPNMGTFPSLEKDLGKIALKTDIQQLSAVVVTSSTPRLRMDIDKKVFSVDQNIVSAGGTAVDVMRNVPSLNVDLDGNVTLRNASPQIFIDGRPTTLTLDQIPADAIESVEIITNPSAKYDASGGNAGILNIVLKKNKKTGYNGNITAGVDKRGGLNGGVSLNQRQNKFNFSVSAFGNKMKNRSTGSTDLTSLISSPHLLVSQENNTRMNNGFVFGRIGADYFATNRLTLSLGGVKVHGKFNPNDFLKSDSAYENGPSISYSERNTQNKRQFDAYGVQGGLKYLFPKKGEELTADFNIFSGKNSGDAYYNTDIYSSAGGAKLGNIQQQILGSGANQFITVQTDYVKPFKGKAKLETGLRAQLRTMSNQQGNYFYNPATGNFAEVASTSSNYKNWDDVYAAYASFTNAIKDFGYQVGLRLESSDYVGELTDTKERFRNTYPLSLFPSIFLSQKLKAQQEIQLSYTRRVNRPFFMQLIPFIDSTDQLNWSRGNAALKPEFTNSLEASYSKTFAGNNTLLFSVYYKYSTDLITRYIDTITIDGGNKRPVNTYINANSSRSVGFELTSQNTFTKWWDGNTNINVYNSRINTNNIDGASQPPMWSWFAKMNNNFKLPKNFKIQLSGTYQSRTNLPVNQGGGMFGGGGGPPMGGVQSAAQGFIRSNYGIDIAIQKSFLKNNAASITFNVNDVFATRRFDQYSVSNFFIQDSHRLNDVPMFRLNFSYRFGQMDMSIFKRKNTKAESEGTQNIMQGMQ